MLRRITLLTLPILALAIGIVYFLNSDDNLLLPDEEVRESNPIKINAPIPATPVDTVLTPKLPISSKKNVIKERQVKYGDSFNRILTNLKVPKNIVNQITAQTPTYLPPKDFQVGNAYQVYYKEGSEVPYLLSYDLEKTTAMQLDLRNGLVRVIEKQVDSEIRKIHTTIQSSLVNSLNVAGAPEDLADKILSVFAWKIDFKNLKKGDHYHVIFQEQSISGEVIGSGFIEAVSFFHDGQTFRAFGFDNGNGIEYFDEKGQNMSYAPLRFEIITSLYAQRRFHPTRRRSQPHYGMDFEAALGTPIESIKDGVVTRVRYDRANGNNVKIQHTKNLTTQYLHMSSIDPAMIVGDSVKQGQVIGLVGSTGYSSGPHLCLRVWYKGKQRDPLNFDFPRREDIKDSLITIFRQKVEQYADL